MFWAVRAGAPRRILRSASVLDAGAGLGCALGGWFTGPPVGAPPAAGAVCCWAAAAGLVWAGLLGAGGVCGLLWVAVDAVLAVEAGAGAVAAACAAGALEAGAVAAVPRPAASGVLLSDTASGRGASDGAVFTGFASPGL